MQLKSKNEASIKRTKNLFLDMTFSRKRFFLGAIFASLTGALVAIVATYLQKKVIDGLAIYTNLPWLELSAIFLFTLLSQCLTFVARFLCLKQATAYFAKLSLRMYQHTLALKPLSRQKHSVGELVSFYAQDMSATVAYLEEFLPSAIVSVIPLLCMPFAARYLHNVPIWGPLLVMVLTVLVCAFLGYRQAVFFGISKNLAEKRLGFVNEWIQNLKIVRALNMEKQVLSKIQAIRIQETQNRKATVTNGSTMNAISQISPLCINIVGLLLFVQTNKGQLTPGDVLGIFWLYGVLCARPLRSLPWALVTLLDANTSRKRLETFFELKSELTLAQANLANANLEKASDESHAALNSIRKKVPFYPSRPALMVENLNLTIGQKSILHKITFSVNEGDFVCIVGNVGSGKSMFLNALLRETDATFDKYEIFGTNTKTLASYEVRSFFGLVPQTSFVMNSNLRDNVAFEYEAAHTQSSNIEESLFLSSFVPANEWMKNGLNTEIGERGVNLSGGQKQRVSLARLHFHKRDILLMDDTLSALDATTEQEIQHNLLLGSWKTKTKLLVTHRHSILPHATEIFFFVNGSIFAKGTFENLMLNCLPFSEFILKKMEEVE